MTGATVTVIGPEGRSVDARTFRFPPNDADYTWLWDRLRLACTTNLRPTVRCAACLEDRVTSEIVQPCEQHRKDAV